MGKARGDRGMEWVPCVVMVSGPKVMKVELMCGDEH